MIAISFSANGNVYDCFANKRITEMLFLRIFRIFNAIAYIFIMILRDDSVLLFLTRIAIIMPVISICAVK